MSVLASIRSQLVPVHREGLPFIGGFALVSLILFWIWTPLGWIGTALTVWCALFFRDPVDCHSKNSAAPHRQNDPANGGGFSAFERVQQCARPLLARIVRVSIDLAPRLMDVLAQVIKVQTEGIQRQTLLLNLVANPR